MPEDIHAQIEQLVAEEHRLWQLEASGNSGDHDRQRLSTIKVELDQYSDLLRRRRAAIPVVYQELLDHVSHTSFTVQQTYLSTNPQEDPRTTPSENAWIRLEADIDAVGSKEVLHAAQEFSLLTTAFYKKAWAWKTSPGDGQHTPGRRSELTAPHEAMGKARANLETQARVVEQLVRKELARSRGPKRATSGVPVLRPPGAPHGSGAAVPAPSERRHALSVELVPDRLLRHPRRGHLEDPPPHRHHAQPHIPSGERPGGPPARSPTP